MSHFYPAILGSAFWCLCLNGCTPPPPPGEMRISDYHGPAPEMYMARFNMTSAFLQRQDMDQFSFFPKADPLIIVEPLLSDSGSAPQQRSIFLTTVGKWECTERKNPPVLPGFTYAQRCFRLVARTDNSFTVDSTFKLRNSEGEYERAGQLDVQIEGLRCSAQFRSPRRNFANLPTFSPLTVVGGFCKAVLPPKLATSP